MKNVTVTLHTGEHCVETEAKNEYRRITGLLLEAEDGAEVEKLGEELELLREFIEKADFNALRSSDERLAGVRPGRCVIDRSGGVPRVKEVLDAQH